MVVDVAILGGGPAGCAAALTLRRYSERSVALVERGAYQRVRVGETMGPGSEALLRYLGFDGAVPGVDQIPGRGTTALWGSEVPQSTHFLYTGRGTGRQLDRRAFDQGLAAACAEAGAAVFSRASPRRVDRRDGGGFALAVERLESRERLRVECRFLVDATGRHCWAARRLGAERRLDDELVGIVGFAASPPEIAPGQTLIESRPDGWWYSAELPGRRTVLAFMTDADLLRELRLQEPARWRALLAESSATKRRVAPEALDEELFVRPAASGLLWPAAGDAWLAVGDAALSFDPLSGMGIGSALSSGAHAARALDAALDGDGALLAQYRDLVPRTYDDYLLRRGQYYRLEPRWADRPFWARRHGEAAPPMR